MLDAAAAERALLLAGVSAVVVAILGTFIVFPVWRWVVRRSSMRALAGVLAAIGLAAVYVASAATLMFLANWLPNRTPAVGEQLYVTTTYVHPGVLLRIAPALALLITWVALSLRKTGNARTAA